jgi:predicted outer membrane repeat protein
MKTMTTFLTIFYRFLVLMPGLLSFTSVWSQTVYVTPAGAGQQTGADWTNALSGTALQARLASASEGTVFRLAGGLYKPTTTNDRSLSFLVPSGVQVYGGYQGSGATPDQRVDFASVDQPSSTTLSGDIDNDNQLDAENTNNVVAFSNVNEQTRLDGLVITGGYAMSPFLSSDITGATVGGGGIYNDAYTGPSNPTIDNCLLTNNYTIGSGGGLYSDTRYSSVSLRLTNTDFIRNTAYRGGAINNNAYTSGSFRIIASNCRFLDNSANWGGAVYTDVFTEFRGAPIISLNYVNCSFSRNTASSQGGAFYTYARGTVALSAVNQLTNCTVSGNSAQSGGAFFNTARPYAVRFVFVRSGVNLTNSILWNNGGTNAIINEDFRQPGITSMGEGYSYSSNGLLEANAVLTGGTGNQFITSSPFVSGQSFQLTPCSPGINAGLNAAYSDANGPATDLAGNERIVPAGGTIDLGAYESRQGQGPSITITRQPVSQSRVQAGATVQVPVGISAPAASYVWYKNGAVVSDQVSATLTLADVQPNQSGSYRLVATTPCNSLTTDAFSLSVVSAAAAPQVSVTSSATALCVGGSSLLTARVVGGTAPYTYAWTSYGSAKLINPVNETITLTAVNPEYVVLNVLITDANSLTATADVWVTINALPDAGFSGLPGSVCQTAGLHTLTPAVAGGTFSGAGIEGARFNPAALGVGGPYSITYTVTSQGCTNSSSQTVSVGAPPSPPSLVSQSGQLYAGGQSQLTVPQHSGMVTLLASGCVGGTLHVSEPGTLSSTGELLVSTSTLGTFAYAVTCEQNGCRSEPARATVTVQAAALQVMAPLFDCATNQLTLRTSGGNGQPIEYHIPSVTQGWTTANAVPVQAKHFKKELKIRARQATTPNDYNTNQLDYRLPACGSARQAAPAEELTGLQVRVLGNPVVGAHLLVDVLGAEGLPVAFDVVDVNGRLITSCHVERANAVEQQRLAVGESPAGVLLLRVSSASQVTTIRLLKQ